MTPQKICERQWRVLFYGDSVCDVRREVFSYSLTSPIWHPCAMKDNFLLAICWQDVEFRHWGSLNVIDVSYYGDSVCEMRIDVFIYYTNSKNINDITCFHLSEYRQDVRLRHWVSMNVNDVSFHADSVCETRIAVFNSSFALRTMKRPTSKLYIHFNSLFLLIA